MLRSDLEEIEALALKLLLKEPEGRRKRLVAAADRELMDWGIDAHIHWDETPQLWVRDIVNAPGLMEVASLQNVMAENVLNAEDFRDLIDRLIPAMSDR